MKLNKRKKGKENDSGLLQDYKMGENQRNFK